MTRTGHLAGQRVVVTGATSGLDGVRVESMRPGRASTPGVVELLPLFDEIAKPLPDDAEDGADAAVWLVAARPWSRPGHFWPDRTPRPTTVGWQRREDSAKVACFLEQVTEMTSTSTDWPRLRN